MERGIFIIALVAMASMAAMVILGSAFSPFTSATGETTREHGQDEKDFELAFTVIPNGPVKKTTTLLLSANAKKDEKITSLTFSAQNGNCVATIGSFEADPYETTWQPASSGCGLGMYTLRATATDKLGRQQTKTKTLEVVGGYVLAEASTVRRSSTSTIFSSATNYPPAQGTSGAQNFVTIPIVTSTLNEKYTIQASITGSKSSGGTFDLQYRIFEQSTTSVLAEGVITNPSGPTASSLQTELVIPGAGEQRTLLFQFRSSQLFSSVALNSYDVKVERYVWE